MDRYGRYLGSRTDGWMDSSDGWIVRRYGSLPIRPLRTYGDLQFRQTARAGTDATVYAGGLRTGIRRLRFGRRLVRIGYA